MNELPNSTKFVRARSIRTLYHKACGVSATYDIACKDCEACLWIAQKRHDTEGRIYTGEPETMEALKHFLFAHAGHHLVFEPSEEHSGFAEIDAEADE